MKLPFKSSDAFFEFCNKQFSANPKKGEGRPAIVPQPGFMDIERHVSPTEDGRFRLNLLVCGAPSGFFTMSETPTPGEKAIEHGDLVIWQAFIAPPLLGKGTLGKLTGDKRSN